MVRRVNGALRFCGCASLSLVLALCLCAPHAAQAQTTYTESVILNFCSPNCALGEPSGFHSLIQASDGNYYGTVDNGGTTNNSGLIYQMTPAGVVTGFYEMCSQPSCPDGETPGGPVNEGPDGALYGDAYGGGLLGYGLVYKVNLSTMALSKLYPFCEQTSCTDGRNPAGGMVLGSDGDYYGVAEFGGTGATDAYGVLFKTTTAGSLAAVYNFCNTASCADGEAPMGPPVQASDGNFYGITPNICQQYCEDGNLYEVSGGTLTTLHTFCRLTQCLDGSSPVPALVEAFDGNLYGVTTGGGSQGNFGTIYYITPGGSSITTVYNFCNTEITNICQDGNAPTAGMILASDGNLYGTTSGGGVNNKGTIFQFNVSTQTLTTIYNFCLLTSCADGASPNVALIQGSDGNLYGVGTSGGSANEGALYKLAISPAIQAPVQVGLSSNLVSTGTPVTLTWMVENAASDSMQQCYAHIVGTSTGAGAWTGKQTGTLSGDVYSGTATLTPTASGKYTYALTCGGVESGSVTLTAQGMASLATITATPSSASIGQTVTLSATVSGASGTPTGNVSFYAGTLLLHTSTLSGGVATYSASTASGVPPGTYPVHAVYAGNSTYNGTTSGSKNVVMTKAPTATALSATPNPVTQGSNVTLTATVTRSAAGASGAPGGTIVFAFGTATLGSVTLNSSGVASVTLPTSSAPKGTYGITAKYSGDADDNASTSPLVNLVVD